MIVVVPLLALLVYTIFRYQYLSVSRLIFAIFALYALYGLGRNLRRRRNKRAAMEADVDMSEHMS